MFLKIPRSQSRYAISHSAVSAFTPPHPPHRNPSKTSTVQRWRLGMGTLVHPALHRTWSYLTMLGSKLINVSTCGPWRVIRVQTVYSYGVGTVDYPRSNSRMIHCEDYNFKWYFVCKLWIVRAVFLMISHVPAYPSIYRYQLPNAFYIRTSYM